MRVLCALLFPALAAATALPAPGAPALPQGTYRYEIDVAGHVIGASTIVVQDEAGAMRVGESASLGGVALISDRTIQSSSFATLSYAADAGGKRIVVAMAGNTATLSVAGTSVTISAAAGAPFLVSDNMVAGFAQIPAMLHATGASRLTLACVCGAFLAVPMSVTSRTPESVTLSVEGALATLAYDPRSYVLIRFELPSQQLTITLQSHDAALEPLRAPSLPTPVPLPSPRYAARDVAIRTDDGVTLRGTLTVPDGASRPPPAFVFVHGSGCLDRDETIGPNKVFAQLANRVSNDGYAVLRYDKRSCGKSGGTFPTRNRLIADARTAIAYLRAQPQVDPRRIYVLGHSEGGELAPSIAIADGRLRGIVLLAPPALPLDRILMQQILRTAPATERAAIERRERAELDAIAAGKKKGAQAAWLRSSFGIDPARLIARVPCPVLIVQGTKDIQVLAADTPRLVAAARSTKRDLTVSMLDGDDHLFIKLSAGESSTGAEYFIPSYLDPALFVAIESWLEREAPGRP